MTLAMGWDGSCVSGLSLTCEIHSFKALNSCCEAFKSGSPSVIIGRIDWGFFVV